MSSPQIFSHYPTWPPPRRVPLVTVDDHACPYLPNRTTRMRMIVVRDMPAALYHQFMDAGFRRSGRLLYQPACKGCRQCIPIRVPVDRFLPNKSQRRCARRNDDLRVEVGPPKATDEKHALYNRYIRDWHGRERPESDDESRESFESFLYTSPLQTTLEFTYRDNDGRLLAVGICDSTSCSLSSVYCFFDPLASKRGLGTYAAMREIEYARSHRLSHYYLGYWVYDCPSMNYKSDFSPNEVLHTDGIWREQLAGVTGGIAGNKIIGDQNDGESMVGPEHGESSARPV